jgi:hypothetical protein
MYDDINDLNDLLDYQRGSYDFPITYSPAFPRPNVCDSDSVYLGTYILRNGEWESPVDLYFLPPRHKETFEGDCGTLVTINEIDNKHNSYGSVPFSVFMDYFRRPIPKKCRHLLDTMQILYKRGHFQYTPKSEHTE